MTNKPMSGKLRYASTLAVAATLITTLVSAEGSGVAAQPLSPAAPTEFTSQPIVQPLPALAVEAPAEDSAQVSVPVDAASLSQLVAVTPTPSDLSNELACLAGAIYFESKGETLAGQLAVGRVIVARAKSGRFPASYCGVVYQRSQFSFVQGRGMPTINKAGRAWTDAARIARDRHVASSVLALRIANSEPSPFGQ